MFTKKKIRLPNGVRVKISRHFTYNTFGVRGRYDVVNRTGLFVNSLKPGVGFFVHDSDSRSYRTFVRGEKKKIEQSFRTLYGHREPSIDRELKRVEKRLDDKDLPKPNKQVLSQYLSMLRLAQEEQLYQRIVRGIKDKVGHRQNEKTSFYTSILSNYKSRIATLQHDAAGTQLNVYNMLGDEAKEKWQQVCESFRELVEVRRLWHMVDNQTFEQVFFDMGIFDYIQSPFDTPVMRDKEGIHYYLYPQGVIRARSNVDFDFIPMSELQFVGSVIDLNTLNNAAEMSPKRRRRRNDTMSTLYATTAHGINAVGQLECKGLGLNVCCNHLKPVMHFAEAIEEFRRMEDIPLDFSILKRGGG